MMVKYWFRKRRGLFTRDLGWGYRPVSIEGWISILVLVLLIVLLMFVFDLKNSSFVDGFGFLASVLALLIIFHRFAKNKTRR
jgi:hypothetical protein